MWFYILGAKLDANVLSTIATHVISDAQCIRLAKEHLDLDDNIVDDVSKNLVYITHETVGYELLTRWAQKTETATPSEFYNHLSSFGLDQNKLKKAAEILGVKFTGRSHVSN
jgi:EAL domain-containing protein (putative c-di-GMP-specific phosphodiesterase class I)